MTNSEQADLIRSLIRHRGWTELQDPTIRAKMDTMKDQLLLDADERQPDVAKWSHDKFAGFIMGLGWSRNVLVAWLQRYDDDVNQKAAADAEQAMPDPVGHPYANGEPTQPSEVAN